MIFAGDSAAGFTVIIIDEMLTYIGYVDGDGIGIREGVSIGMPNVGEDIGSYKGSGLNRTKEDEVPFIFTQW